MAKQMDISYLDSRIDKLVYENKQIIFTFSGRLLHTFDYSYLEEEGHVRISSHISIHGYAFKKLMGNFKIEMMEELLS